MKTAISRSNHLSETTMIKRFVALASVCLGTASQAWAGVSGVYDANHVLIGEYVESPTIIHTVQGFRFELDSSTGAVSKVGTIAEAITDIGGAHYLGLNYSTTDCTGQPYTSVDKYGALAGGVIIDGGSKGAFYVQKPVASSNLAVGSYFDTSANVCAATQPSIATLVPVLPNDSTVTGVPNTPFALPIHLEVVPLSQFFEIIFKNGFESSFQDARQYTKWQSTRNQAIAAMA